MAARTDVWVVVPAYNEARVIRSTVSPLIRERYSVVVVDDGSKDGTGEALAGSSVHYLRHAINLGAGAATQTGVTYALRHGAQFIVHFDADGQHSADEIESLIEPLRAGRADVALGSRFLRQSDAKAVPPLKRVVLRGGVFFNWLVSRIWLTDAHNGFRAFNRRAASLVNLRENGYAHATELLVQLHQHRLQVVEVPTHVHYTEYSLAKGQSMLNAFNIVFDSVVGRVHR